MAGIELATAYVSIVPSAKGIQGKLAAEMGGAAPVATAAGHKAGKGFLGGMSSQLKHSAGMIGLAIGASAIEHFFHAGVEAAEDFHRTELLTAAAIKSTGQAAGVSAEHIDQLSTSLGKTDAVSRKSIMQIDNMLLRFTQIKNSGPDKIFDRATAAILDLSAATGRDGVSAARMLGKALNDPVTQVGSLTRAGVAFTAEQKKQIKAVAESGDLLGAQSMILDGVTKSYGGSAAALATPTQRLKVGFASFRTGIGKTILPVVEEVAGALNDHLIPALKSVPETIKTNWGLIAPTLDTVGAAFVELWGAVVDLWNILQPVGLLIGGVFLVAIRLAAPAVEALAGGIHKLTGALSGQAPIIQAVIAAILAMWGAMKLYGIIRLVMGAFQAFGQFLLVTLGRAALAVEAFGAMASAALGVVGIAIGIAVYLWQRNASAVRKAKEAAAEHKAVVEDLTHAIEADNGALGESTRLSTFDALKKNGAVDAARRLGLSIKDLTDSTLGNLDAELRMNNAIVANVQQGGKRAADANTLAAGMNDVGSAILDASDTYGQLEESQGKVKGSTEKTTVAMQSQEDTAKALKESLDELSGKAITSAQSELDLQTQLDGLTKSVKDNGKSLGAHNKKTGLYRTGVIANRQALLSAISTINDHTAAVYDQTGSVDSAVAVMRRDEDQLRRSAYAAGLNKAQVDFMIKAYEAVPKDVKTDLDADPTKAKKAIDDVKHKAEGTKPTVDIRPNLGPVTEGIKSYVAPPIYIPAHLKLVQSNIGGHKVSTGATGGYLSSQNWNLVGENGPELLSPSGMVHTAGDTVDRLVSTVSDRVGAKGGAMRVAGGAVSLSADSQGNLHAWVRDLVLAESQFGATTSRMRVTS